MEIALGPVARALLLACAALGTVACRAQRELRITSDPEGATVRVDDVLIGTTPLSMPFVHYGVRRVTFYLDGHQTRSVLAEVRAPWYARFPADLVTEILVPIGWHDVHALHVTLVPGDDTAAGPTLRSVFERAEALSRAGPQGPRDLQPPPVFETSAALDQRESAATGDATPPQSPLEAPSETPPETPSETPADAPPAPQPQPPADGR